MWTLSKPVSPSLQRETLRQSRPFPGRSNVRKWRRWRGPTRSDVEFLCAVCEGAVRTGATTINIPDTVGYAIPSEFGELIRTLCQRVKGIEKVTLSVHCHNDLGLAVANYLPP